MIKAVEGVYGSLNDGECPSPDYLAVKAEETECNEPVAASLDEILNRKDTAHSQLQSTVDNAGHIRVTRTRNKGEIPSSTEEYRRTMKVEAFSWLCMASRYKAKSWLHGLELGHFTCFVEFILGERVLNIQVPLSTGDNAAKVKPDWRIVLGYELKLRQEAMKLVVNKGYTLADALEAVTKDSDLKESYFTTPLALKGAMGSVEPPPQNKFPRFNFKGQSGQQGFKGNGKAQKGKTKGKGQFKEIHEKLRGLSLSWRTPDNRDLCFAWNSGSCNGGCGRVHQCRVKGCYGDHPAIRRKLAGTAAPEASCPPFRLNVMYLFAGKRRQSDVASFLKKAADESIVELHLEEIDIERSPDHDLADDALWNSIFAKLQKDKWFLVVSPPCNTFSRARFHRRYPGPRPLRTRMWRREFPWLSKRNRELVDEANPFVDQCVAACLAGGDYLFEHPEDLGMVGGELPGSVWQWQGILGLITATNATWFAIHQCAFGAITPKPTRLLSSRQVDDPRCFKSMPAFNHNGVYKGPLPRQCGHVHSHKLSGKTAERWNTSPSASYPEGLCFFIADLILTAGAAFGRGFRTLGRHNCISAMAPLVNMVWMVAMVTLQVVRNINGWMILLVVHNGTMV